MRNAVHYVLFAIVHPAYVAKGALIRLARESWGLEADEGALVIFDAPLATQPGERGGIAEMAVRLAKMVSSGAETEMIEVQRYYAIDFAKGARHLSRDARRARRAIASVNRPDRRADSLPWRGNDEVSPSGHPAHLHACRHSCMSSTTAAYTVVVPGPHVMPALCGPRDVFLRQIERAFPGRHDRRARQRGAPRRPRRRAGRRIDRRARAAAAARPAPRRDRPDPSDRHGPPGRAAEHRADRRHHARRQGPRGAARRPPDRSATSTPSART